MSSERIGSAEKQHYAEQGYLVVPGLFEAESPGRLAQSALVGTWTALEPVNKENACLVAIPDTG